MANKKLNVDGKNYSDIPVWRRYTLTIEEAAGYYHIGIQTPTVNIFLFSVLVNITEPIPPI